MPIQEMERKVKTYVGNNVGVTEAATINAVKKAFSEVESGSIVERVEITPNQVVMHCLKIF
jgi:hypothetical protein